MSSVSESILNTSWALSSFFRDAVIPSCKEGNINRPTFPALLQILSDDDTVRFAQNLSVVSGQVRANEARVSEENAPLQNIPLYQYHADMYFEKTGVRVAVDRNAMSIHMKVVMKAWHVDGGAPLQVAAAKSIFERTGVRVAAAANAISRNMIENHAVGGAPLQVAAANYYFKRTGVRLTADDNAISLATGMRSKDIQNMTQEEEKKRQIKMRLALMNNGLVNWDKQFKKFVAFRKRMPT